MAAGRAHPPARRLLLDVPLALLVGAGTWFSLVVSRFTPGRAGGPPWRGDGPRDWPDGPGPGADVPWLLALLLALVVVSLALRRVRTVPALVGVAAGTAGLLAAGASAWPLLLAPALALAALTSSRPPASWWRWTLVLVPVLVAPWWPSGAGRTALETASATTVALLVWVLAALAGLLGRSRRLAWRRARDEELRQSADAERLRIAREVHDLVGHSLSVITMQAGVALHVVNRRPEQAEEALRAIRRTGLDAMSELRSTLGVFRGEQDTHPPAGVERLPTLVADLRSAGQEVALRVDPALGVVAPSVSHAVYRIVQESLTNVSRHAPAAAAEVDVRREGDVLVVEVADSGPLLTAAPPTPGHGIAGMTERARALGGTLEVAARPGGGVLVRATIPVEEAR
ncbi:sensor histidine kinase [Auraticoccus monumenti]|uniref:histidine kinase n=1 Tax=Auraticoccus monumenti TaxID=675864 RepID=A0A1G6WD71_9ACTN|nr:sensor histidine kinase [Auraticoccus monumenti]SDD63734.1 Signal transduction histidine kinase [Auraticoccus monumenti]